MHVKVMKSDTEKKHRKQHKQRQDIRNKRDPANSKQRDGAENNQTFESMLPFGLPILHRIVAARQKEQPMAKLRLRQQ